MDALPDRPSLDGLEDKWAARWEAAGTYRFDRSRPRADVFSIDSPPLTVSGSLHVAARTPDGEVVWQIVDAVEGPGLRATRLRTVAADAASTVRLEFAGLPVAAGRQTLVEPYSEPGVTGPPRFNLSGSGLAMSGFIVERRPRG